MNAPIASAGYVNLSRAALLAQHNTILTLAIVPADRVSPIKGSAYRDAGFVISATSIDCDPQTNFFNAPHVETVIEELVAIQHTVPVGYTKTVRKSLTENSIYTSRVTTYLDAFKQIIEVIIANRCPSQLAEMEGRVYTRALVGGD